MFIILLRKKRRRGEERIDITGSTFNVEIMLSQEQTSPPEGQNLTDQHAQQDLQQQNTTILSHTVILH